MKNWKDYVGLQTSVPNVTSDALGGHYIFVMKVTKKEENALSITIEKELIPFEEYKYTKDEIGNVIESILSEFPKWDKWEKFEGEDTKTWNFGFGPYKKIIDGDRIYVKNHFYIHIPIFWPFDKVDDSEKDMDKFIKELRKDYKKLSDEDFEAKYNIPKSDSKWLRYIPTKLGVISIPVYLPYLFRESAKDRHNLYNYYRMGNKIASQTRRGIGKTKARIENTISVFYKGTSPYDVPLIVSEREGKYAVYKHPDFEKYGFTVDKND